VLFSDLVHACGNNVHALDFIIAHELGHLHRGHLNLRWLFAPALFIPFLGTAYSRACEYTCDRYGFQASDDPDLSLDGLCILAAGPQFAPAVNRRAFAAQDRDLNTAFMKLGEWFATHPPLALRLSALASNLRPARVSSLSASLGALAVAVLIVVIPIGAGGFFIKSAIDDVAKTIANASNARTLPSATPSSLPSYPGDRTRLGR
jgi:Zn-dependent protease with chaperone function